ncbi:MAG: restriction endonuclease subunit S [Kofleriaceae bacterium]|nr:restriction endonuclease subunit S [Kofleriaceae bacterium]
MTLPAGWHWTSLEELIGEEAPIVYGIIQAGPEVANGVPYIRPTELVDGRIVISSLKRTSTTIASKYARSTLRAGDIVLAIVGTIGKLAIVPPELEGANITQSSARLRPPTFISPFYLAAALQSPQLRAQFDQMEFGVAVRRLNISHVRALRVPVAPANEQRRIVSKLEAIFEKTRAAKARLERLPALLHALKRSVLAAAFRGDLTADWRETHPHVEPASVLAERIRAQRDDRTSLPPDTAYSSELPDAELPDTWFVSLTANVGQVQLGRQLSAGKYSGALHPYVRVANVADDRISFDDIKEMEFSPQELAQYLLRPGDIVLSEGQSLDRLGQSAMYRAGDPPVCYQKTLNRFRATVAGPLPEYAQLYFRFCMHTGVFRAAGSITTNIAHLTQEKLRRIPFVLCPLDEQRVLVERVRSALARVDDLARAVSETRAKLAAVEKAALAKAFRGELVDQDPADEPAAVLLDRIRAAAEDAATTTGAKRTRAAVKRTRAKARAATAETES